MTQSQPFTPQAKQPVIIKGPSHSIFKETWRLFISQWRLVLIFGFLYAAVTASVMVAMPDMEPSLPVMTKCNQQADTKACQKEHEAEIKAEAEIAMQQIMHNAPIAITVGVLFLISMFVISYALSITYMRKVMKNAPDYNVSTALRYMGLLVWKYIRPCGWALIVIPTAMLGPVVIIGTLFAMVMIIRSILRSELVGPLVLLGEAKPFATSRERTKGNCWRIFGVQYAWAFLLVLVIAPVMIASTIYAITHGVQEKDFLQMMIPLQAIISGLSYPLMIFLSFAAFRVLSKEAKAKQEAQEKPSLS